MLLESYAHFYFTTPKKAEDLIRHIEKGDVFSHRAYAREYNFLLKHKNDLQIITSDTAILLKTRRGKVFFYGMLPDISAHGDGIRGRIHIYDKDGYISPSDSLRGVFSNARVPIIRKYHPQWEPSPKWVWKWRRAVFEATPEGMRPMFREDSIDTTTEYYADLERVARQFLHDNDSISKVVFDSWVFQKRNDPDIATFAKSGRPIVFDSTVSIPFYIETKEVDSIFLQRVELSKDPNIELYTYNYLPPREEQYESNHAEYLRVGEKTFSLDSLLQAPHNDIIEKGPYIVWRDMNYFSMGGHDYVLIVGIGRYYFARDDVYSYLLFDSVSGKFQNIHLLYNGHYQKSVFNDFDGDGRLDYLRWGVDMRRADLFHIDGSRVEKTPYHLLISPLPTQTSERLDWYSDVDKENSVWF